MNGLPCCKQASTLGAWLLVELHGWSGREAAMPYHGKGPDALLLRFIVATAAPQAVFLSAFVPLPSPPCPARSTWHADLASPVCSRDSKGLGGAICLTLQSDAGITTTTFDGNHATTGGEVDRRLAGMDAAAHWQGACSCMFPRAIALLHRKRA